MSEICKKHEWGFEPEESECPCPWCRIHELETELVGLQSAPNSIKHEMEMVMSERNRYRNALERVAIRPRPIFNAHVHVNDLIDIALKAMDGDGHE